MSDDSAARDAVLSLLEKRSPGASICPSEAARRLDPTHWRDEMARVRAVAARLVAEGRLEVTQKGAVVDPALARGPIRLRLARA
ncbi:MAG: DUF3253 domain-containing protein [Pseudomonadota bacterium]